MCHGKSVGEIALLEGRSIEEIEGHLECARIAVGATTLNDAVAQACQIYAICSGGEVAER